ncbi:hypothetical protein CQW23_26605 [Capsicum baccatum]|uniref:NB-ARC domain-containing protein n=1 Tax=Capsicum baccatum TaxID=33114 RepID=A0A2G2VP98_CAPBA|nr:hypothetical protein CQW23_26605 [Capsicum baccatum]
MEVGLAVGGAFLSSALNVMFDRLAAQDAISNLQVSDLKLYLSDGFSINIKEKLENTIGTLEELQNQIARLDLPKYLDSGKQETREYSTSVVVESKIFGRQNEIEELVGHLLSDDACGNKLTVIPIVGMAGIGKTTLAEAVYNDESVKNYFDLKAWICVYEPYDALRIIKELLLEIG